jgi:hypothetical protein
MATDRPCSRNPASRRRRRSSSSSMSYPAPDRSDYPSPLRLRWNRTQVRIVAWLLSRSGSLGPTAVDTGGPAAELDDSTRREGGQLPPLPATATPSWTPAGRPSWPVGSGVSPTHRRGGRRCEAACKASAASSPAEGGTRGPMDREWRTCAWMQNNAFPTASMPRSLPPLLVLTSERAPRPWSTRCRCCRWLSPQATLLDEAMLAVALHSCPPTGAERSQPTAASEHARRLALHGSGGW